MRHIILKLPRLSVQRSSHKSAYISTRLARGFYHSTHEFVFNVRMLLYNAVRSESGFRLEASKYLFNFAENLLCGQLSGLTSCVDSLHQVEKMLEELQQQCEITSPPPVSRVNQNAMF